MPGYHGTKVSFQPEFHNMHQSRSKEILYPRHFPMGKGPMVAQPMPHPMFEAMRARLAAEKAEYARMMKARDLRKSGGDVGYPTFDSLKLLGADNDANYLDVFMGNGKHPRAPSDESDIRPRARSCSQATKNNHNNNNSKRNSLNVDSIKKTIIGSLRSAASHENIYESVEVIQYRKTIEAIKRQSKIRSVQKTGHPLFDHLREERVLNSDRHPSRHSSDGGSNSQSSSGSGDEFEYAKKPNCRFSRREVLMSSRDAKKPEHKDSHPQKTEKRNSRQTNNEAGSESDDDWLIPRPKICGKGRSRRTGATGLARSGSLDESDSSSKSTGLR